MIRAAWLYGLRLLKAYGIDLKRFGKSIAMTGRFIGDYRAYRTSFANAKEARGRFPLRLRRLQPCLADYDDAAGALGNYFHQDLWAARKIYARRPQRHMDIGSRIDGFVGHLLVFMDVDIVDVRALPSKVQGLSFIQADATEMSLFETGSIPSLSSLHAAEHFGLGRYGDKVDPDACFHFMRALQRVLSPGGQLLFSVPIGQQGVFFNSFRVFAPATVLETFNELTLVSFGAVAQDTFIEKADADRYLKDRYKVGLFEFTKPVA